MAPQSLATDGTGLYYNGAWLAQRYERARSLVCRAYLHSLLHCMLRHPPKKAGRDGELWDLACDIAVESILDTLPQRCPTPATPRPRRAHWYGLLQAEMKVITAEAVYRYFRRHPLDEMDRATLAREFLEDDHRLWERAQNDEAEMKVITAEAVYRYFRRHPLDEMDRATLAREFLEDDHRLWERAQNDEQEQNASSQWQNIAERIQTQLETMYTEAGAGGDAVLERLRVENRPTANYKAFLHRFAVLGEEMSVDVDSFDYGYYTYGLRRYGNMPLIEPLETREARAFLHRFAVLGEEMSVDVDSFDYGYYTYGLRRYGNMPLIEPLETREARRIEDLVIAIDTSMSTSGALVRSFLSYTYAILKNTESFFRRFQLRILQCDDQLRADKTITSAEELADYMEHFELIGQSATDFRPVFAHVNKLREEGAFRHLKGILYFTDGLGVYPAKRPPYDAVFVMLAGPVFAHVNKLREEGAFRHLKGILYFTDGLGVYPAKRPPYDAVFVMLAGQGNPERVPPWGIRLLIDEDELTEATSQPTQGA